MSGLGYLGVGLNLRYVFILYDESYRRHCDLEHTLMWSRTVGTRSGQQEQHGFVGVPVTLRTLS